MSTYPADDVIELLRETYTTEGQILWLRQWDSAEPEGRRILELHLRLGAEGACS